MAATATLSELVSPWCQPTTEPGDSGRKVRALNPLSAEDAALLTAVSDPKWQLEGLRNRELCEALYGVAPEDAFPEGVDVTYHGRLTKDDPAMLAQLLELYRRATFFVLPTDGKSS